MTSQHCPVCFADLEPNARYRRYLCAPCAGRAVSASGRPLVFHNASFAGGFVALHADDGTPHVGHQCFVDGLSCFADEARFGGIVVEAAPMETVFEVADIESLIRCAAAEGPEERLSVFQTQVGLRFRPQRRLLIVGRATNGWGIAADGPGECQTQYPAAHSRTVDGLHDWAERTLAHVDPDPLDWTDHHASRSGFVRVARRIAVGLGAPAVGWYQQVAWSQLYKLGRAAGENPSEDLMNAQLPVCRSLLDKELRVLAPHAVVFLVGCSPSGDWFQWFDQAIGFHETARHVVGRDDVRLGLIRDTRAVVLPHPQGRAETPLVEAALAHLG